MALHIRTARASTTDMCKRLLELEGQIGNLVASLASVSFNAAVASALQVAEREKAELEEALAIKLPSNTDMALD